MNEYESLQQHVNNITRQQNEEIKQNDDKLREAFMTENASSQQDMDSITQQQNEELNNNINNLRANLDERMDKIFDKQQKTTEKKLSIFSAQTQSRTPSGIEQPPSKGQGVESITSEFFLPSDDKSTNNKIQLDYYLIQLMSP